MKNYFLRTDQMRVHAITVMFLLFALMGLCVQAQVEISEGFEGKLPDFHVYRATYTSDLSRAHSGACSLRGVVRAQDWRPADREFMLALSTSGECWFDDVILRKVNLPEPPGTYTAFHFT